MNRRLCNQRTRGLTLVEVILVVAALAVMAGLLLPALAKSSKPRHRINCVTNLKQIGLAFRMFSNDHGERFPWAVPAKDGGTLDHAATPDVFRHYLAISNEVNSPKVLVCNTDVTRVKVASWEPFTGNGNLSYFAGLDAHESRPQTILAGDRNVTTNGRTALGVVTVALDSKLGFTRDLHKDHGNIALGDGSAAQVTPSGLQKQAEAHIRGGPWGLFRLAVP